MPATLRQLLFLPCFLMCLCFLSFQVFVAFACFWGLRALALSSFSLHFLCCACHFCVFPAFNIFAFACKCLVCFCFLGMFLFFGAFVVWGGGFWGTAFKALLSGPADMVLLTNLVFIVFDQKMLIFKLSVCYCLLRFVPVLSRLVGGWLVGWLAGWPVGWLLCWLVGGPLPPILP